MRPSPVLYKRIKSRAITFTTKDVAGGFYRGTGTGSMGAHTPTGGYLIDYRKVRHFVKPYMDGEKKLKPFVSAELYPGYRRIEDQRGNVFKLKYDGMQYLDWYRHMNEMSYDNTMANSVNSIERAEAGASTASAPQEEELYMGQEGHGSSHQQQSTSSPSQKS